MRAVLRRGLLAAVAIATATRGAPAQPPGAPAAPAARVLPAVPRDEFAARRRALVAALPDSVDAVVVLGAREPAADYLRFDQAPDFRYLTGFLEPDAALVLARRAGGDADGTLFVQPNDPAREVWTGRRAGVAGARAATGLAARPAGEFRQALDSVARAAAAAGRPLAVVGQLAAGGDVLTPDAQLVAALRRDHPALRVVSAGGAVARLRGRKSAAELARVRRAVEVTVEAQRAAMGLVAPGVNEYEVQALIEYTFRRRGADRPSFATIVGSGPNSTTLHYNADDREMRAGEVVVMDVGASWDGLRGRRDAHGAGERALHGGAARGLPARARRAGGRRARRRGRRAVGGAVRQRAPHGGARARAAGARRVGGRHLRLRRDGAERQCPQWSLYYMHGLGHGIGLEVHDPEQAMGARRRRAPRR
jgi:Xaa-Pro aminopeptidase